MNAQMLAEPAAPVLSHRTPWHVGPVTLAAHDMEALAAFYRDAIGLRERARTAGSVTLGTTEATLLVIEAAPQARRRSPREAGLFHTAFLLPERADLGRWLKHAAADRIPLEGASDHRVSEAIYLADPEGNGIEIYADKPRESWVWQGSTVTMATERLDLNAVMAAGTGDFAGFPAGARIGHIHLQVGDIAAAEAFYAGVLGLDLTASRSGGAFFSSGGYHHHLAANIWNSRGAPARDLPSTGLAGFVLETGDPAALAALRERLAANGIPVTETAEGLSLADPWRNAITLRQG